MVQTRELLEARGSQPLSCFLRLSDVSDFFHGSLSFFDGCEGAGLLSRLAKEVEAHLSVVVGAHTLNQLNKKRADAGTLPVCGHAQESRAPARQLDGTNPKTGKCPSPRSTSDQRPHEEWCRDGDGRPGFSGRASPSSPGFPVLPSSGAAHVNTPPYLWTGPQCLTQPQTSTTAMMKFGERRKATIFGNNIYHGPCRVCLDHRAILGGKGSGCTSL